MAEATPKSSGKSRLQLLVLTITILLSVSLVLVLEFCVHKTDLEGELYPDILHDKQSSSCWETLVFVTTYDPFLKWATLNSIPSSFDTEEQLSTTEATNAYQKQSLWRVWSKKTKDSVSLTSSPEPHILGGQISNSSPLWVKRIHWGISMRYCILGGLDERTSAEACKITVPVVMSDKNKAGLLFTKVNFRLPGSSQSSDKRSAGYYLTNIPTSARLNIALGIPSKFSANSSEAWYYNAGVEMCKVSTPLYPTLDILSTVPYPALQCGCLAPEQGTVVCISGRNLTGARSNNEVTVSGFRFDAAECATARTFWDWDSQIFNSSFGIGIWLKTYSIRWPQVPVNVFMSLNGTGYDMNTLNSGWNETTRPNNETISKLKNVTKCVETWLDQLSWEPTDDNMKSLPGSCTGVFSATRETVAHTIYSDWPKNKITDLFDLQNKVLGPDDHSGNCGIDEPAIVSGEEQRPCLFEISSFSKEANQPFTDLKEKLLQVPNVHRLGEQKWEEGYAKRSIVSTTIWASIVAMVGTFAGVMTKTLQNWESVALRKTEQYTRWSCDRPSRRAVLRTLFRSILVCVSGGLTLLTIFYSIKDAMEKSIATADTILSFTGFLVTTTSTIEVLPRWIVIEVLAGLVFVVMVQLLLFIYYRVLSYEHENQKSEMVLLNETRSITNGP